VQTLSHKVTSSLLNYLETGDEVDRCYAAKTLGNLKATEATKALLARLQDEDIDVCIDAITALGKIKEPSAIPLLLESLEKDPDGDVKLAVTESLAQYKSEAAIDALLKLAEERPENMQFDQNADWDGWWDVQEKAIVILGEMQVAKAFAVLKRVLEDEFGQDIEAIILKAMAKLGTEEADTYLIARLNNKAAEFQERQQRRAATALGFSKSSETLKALGRALVNKSEETRESVIYALGKRKATQYIRAIILSLRDESASVRRAALEVLQQLAGESQNNSQFDYNQIASMLVIEKPTTDDIMLQVAILKFFTEQQKIASVMDTLTPENQQQFIACLSAHDDQVLTQACQMASIIKNPLSAPLLFDLALSETQSAWVRNEAILALGEVITCIQDNDEKQSALVNLRQLIHNKEQTIRASAIQSLLNISNQEPAPSDNSDAELPAISILLATLKGEQFDLNDTNDNSSTNKNMACATGDQPSESNCSSCAQSDTCADDVKVTEAIMKQFDMQDINDSSHLIPENDDQPITAAMSTLDAILMDNIESAQAMVPASKAEKAHNKDLGPFVSEELDKDMDEFVALMQKNFTRGKKLTRRKVDTYADARHICARLLADNSQSDYDEMIVNALSECLNDDDKHLRQEAAESLSQISIRNPLIAGLSNTFGKLITLLDSKDNEMRIACIHAIAHSGNRAALPHLLDYLNDNDYLVQLHALQGLVYIMTNKAGLNAEQQAQYMVLEEVSDETIIKAFFDCLTNPNYSVSMAAIEALTQLQHSDAIEKFIDVALTDEGQSARRISHLLKQLDREKSTELLLTRLDNVSGSSYRRYVMEMLEVVISSEEALKKVA